ncbi:L,D-transpeptidase family protein [Flavobacterium sp. W21_SRS_FM6]|uniref:L,D-transpeptidase family protein n=1 Tax=Flavobacterium sp. W21_SRS_FM6 TaxID=3240268 RepID=UPI003F8DCFD1
MAFLTLRNTLIMLSLSVASLLSACVSQPKTDLPLLQRVDTQQLVLVIADDWEANTATLQKFEWQNNHWQAVDEAFAVNIGRTGLAWGLGLHSAQKGYYKQEGDGKATAGVFDLSHTFGYLEQLNTAMPYTPMTASNYCIDVNGSSFYNQIVDENLVGKDAVKDSTEPMRRDIHNNNQDIYKKGIVLDHNVANISGQGSCIFLHMWFGPGVATAGCTAMSEPDMDRLLAWLDPTKSPRYVALPKAEYLAKQQAWGLPIIN